MRIAFFLTQQGEYRTLGGVINEALKRKHDVFLFFNAEPPRKVSQIRASAANIPQFYNKNYTVISLSQNRELPSSVDKYQIQVIVLHSEYHKMPHSGKDSLPVTFEQSRSKGCKIVSCMYFYDNCAWDISAFTYYDKFFYLSEYAVEQHKELLEGNGVSVSNIKRVFREKIVVTGSAFFDWLDRENSRHDYAKSGNILLTVPNFKSYYQQTVLSKFPKTRTLWHIIKRPFDIRFFLDACNSMNYKDFLSQLYAVARVHQKFLIIKGRKKNAPVYRKEDFLSFCDRYLDSEDENFPVFYTHQLILESCLCFFMRSFGVLESVIAGVPAVNIQLDFTRNEFGIKDSKNIHVQNIRSDTTGSMNNYPGCVWSVHWRDLKSFFRNFRIDDFKPDPVARAAYVRKFCGIYDGVSASARIVDAIENL